MRQRYVSGLVIILAQMLPHAGVTIGNEELTGFFTTFVTIIADFWAMIRRYQMGSIGVFGGRKG